MQWSSPIEILGLEREEEKGIHGVSLGKQGRFDTHD